MQKIHSTRVIQSADKEVHHQKIKKSCYLEEIVQGAPSKSLYLFSVLRWFVISEKCWLSKWTTCSYAFLMISVQDKKNNWKIPKTAHSDLNYDPGAQKSVQHLLLKVIHTNVTSPSVVRIRPKIEKLNWHFRRNAKLFILHVHTIDFWIRNWMEKGVELWTNRA